MSGLEKLKKIGAHKIYEQTHIAKKFVQDILNEDFSSLNKMQFSGFVSILEREYDVDLQELSDAYGLPTKKHEEIKQEPFTVSSADDEPKSGKKSTFYIILGLFVFALVILLLSFLTSSSDTPVVEEVKEVKEVAKEKVTELNNTTIQEAKNNLSPKDDALNEEEVVEVKSIEPVLISKFLVTPRTNLWVGIVNLDNFKRSQKLGSSPFELNANKEWLLVMGHGFVDFEVNGEEKSFSDKNKVWYAYEDGTLTKITRSQFKEKNRGKAW